MSLIISSVGAVAQTAKILYDYYDTHKRNKQLLDILEGFSSNLDTAIERLQAREELLIGKANPALDSIRKDFTNAEAWLKTNDKNLRSFWTALQAADKLQDLDNRLTKAFASKMSVAIFTALQDVNQSTTKIQDTLEGMQGSLEQAVKDASREGLQVAIRELREEAWAARNFGAGRQAGVTSGSGFNNGEAEKIISSLVDQLTAQERMREEEEEARLHFSGYSPSPSYDPRTPSPASAPSSSRPPTSRGTSMWERESQGSQTSYGSNDIKGKNGRRRQPTLPAGSIVFSPLDPFTNQDLVDPVLGNDGLIHDRFTLINARHTTATGEPLVILGDVVQLRLAIFASFPERKVVYEANRARFKAETIQLYEQRQHNQLPEIVNRLSHVLLWEPLSVSIRVRRGIARYRLRELDGSLDDLNKAVDLSKKGAGGTEDAYEPDLDALRARAMVKSELQDDVAAREDVEAVLQRSPHDVFCLSLRASMRGNSGDLTGAQQDLAETNVAITQDTVYRSGVGDSDCDLEYLARGWAYSSINDSAAAAGDFGYSLSLREASPEPYTLACLALAKTTEGLKSGSPRQVSEGQKDFDRAIALIRAFASAQQEHVQLGRYSSGIPVQPIIDGLPVHAFDCFFLRGMAYFAKQEFPKALLDFEQAMRLRPPLVKDTGEFRFALAQIRAETGDRKGASHDFDFAVALKPEDRFMYQTTRDSYGV